MVIPSSSLSAALKPCRTMVWSSAIAILIFGPPFSPRCFFVIASEISYYTEKTNKIFPPRSARSKFKEPFKTAIL
jgi:hypothetical protein